MDAGASATGAGAGAISFVPLLAAVRGLRALRPALRARLAVPTDRAAGAFAAVVRDVVVR